MFRKFASSAGFCHCADENENAGRQPNEIEQENKSTEVQSESEQAIDDEIKREQDHSKFLHAPIFGSFALDNNLKARNQNSINRCGLSSGVGDIDSNQACRTGARHQSLSPVILGIEILFVTPEHFEFCAGRLLPGELLIDVSLPSR